MGRDCIAGTRNPALPSTFGGVPAWPFPSSLATGPGRPPTTEREKQMGNDRDGLKGFGCLLAILGASIVGWWIIVGSVIELWHLIERTCG